jgi:hypothetical protein
MKAAQANASAVPEMSEIEKLKAERRAKAAARRAEEEAASPTSGTPSPYAHRPLWTAATDFVSRGIR